MTINIHQLSDVQTKKIGESTKIWQFCVVLEGAKIGSNCNICSQVFIENDVVIGDNVTIKNGVHLWDGIRVEDNVFIGPNVTFTNDQFPRSKVCPPHFLQTYIKFGASIGANATILPGLIISEGAMVGAGAVVTRSVPANAIVVGNPARIVGYTNVKKEEPNPLKISDDISDERITNSKVSGVKQYQFPLISDMRGSLTVGDFDAHIPFVPKRYFIIFDVPSNRIRGEHAHRNCHQFLVCINGSCIVMADDGVTRSEFILDSPNKGIYLPAMIWGVQYKYSEDAALLVFASHHYDPNDYIRDYSEFLRIVKSKN